MAVAPFGGLAYVEHVDGASCELFGEPGWFGAGCAAEEAHGSGCGRAFDDRAELLAHLLGDRSEFVVFDD